MSHEISQLDVSGIQLRDSKTQPKVSLSREIGEAQIVHNIFGKAKVRIIRKHDNIWQALWLTASFVVAATSTFLLQDWYAARHFEPAQIAASAPAAVQESLPPTHAQNPGMQTLPPPVAIEPAKPAATEIQKPAPLQKGAPQQTAMKAVEKPSQPQIAQIQPVPPKPLAALPKPSHEQPTTVTSPATSAGTAKPQAQPPAVDKVATTPASAVPAAKPVPPKRQPVPGAVLPPVVKPAAQASSPVAAPVLSAPLEKTGAIPAGEKQMSSPVNVPEN